jgi:hypothetical protein
MTQAGGPAALNGFLYQIIQHLAWLANACLSPMDEPESDALLVLEPRAGGDARAESETRYLVDQYKTRKGRTWRLADTESVLRDLRKAVDVSRISARYRFVTDGRAGDLDSFPGFPGRVRALESPAEFDDVIDREFSREMIGTDRQLFARLKKATRSANVKFSHDAETRDVFHLLHRFEMDFEVDSDAGIKRLEKLPRRFAPNPGDETRVRHLLVGTLVDALGKGEARFDASRTDAMLRDAGLNPERVRNRTRLDQTMRAVVGRRLADEKYVPEKGCEKYATMVAGKACLFNYVQ